ncbi:MAG TPA: hypothetical protein VFX55_05705 [Duganella sp.]|nr:hypothetical protein [Duganella sp.]
MRGLLYRSYGELRAHMIMSAEDWMSELGEIDTQAWLHQLFLLAQRRLLHGADAETEQLFLTIERLLEQGNEEVVTAVTTGFLEGFLRQEKLARAIWMPLLGERATAYCFQAQSPHMAELARKEAGSGGF